MLPKCRWSLATNATRRIAQYVPGLTPPSPWTARIPTLGYGPAATLRAWVLSVAFCGLLALAAGPANATAETGMAAMEVPSPQQQTLAGLEGLAEYFFPLDLWFHSYEWCSWPATRRNPGVAVYRVREHPNDPSMLSITYSLLYKHDCGGSLNIESHPGDVESFSYTLVSDTDCPCGWRLFAVKTTAHGGELGNVGVRIVNSCEPLPEVDPNVKTMFGRS